MTSLETSMALMRKRYVTALESAQAGGALALSQRVGELKRAGYLIGDMWRITKSGARVKAYRILKEPKPN